MHRTVPLATIQDRGLGLCCPRHFRLFGPCLSSASKGKGRSPSSIAPARPLHHPHRLTCSTSAAPKMSSHAVELDVIHGDVRIKEGLLDLASHTLSDLLGHKIELQLVSSHLIDPDTQDGKRSTPTELKIGATSPRAQRSANNSSFSLKFSVPKGFGKPGAILIQSDVPREFFLDSITLKLPDASDVYFHCHSWINQSKIYPGPRIFFSNEAYLPHETPPSLLKLRYQELEYLKGDGTGARKTGERIYDYDLYNNLGNPDSDEKLARPVLGGSKELPYPRRCRTGGEHTKFDPASEKPTSASLLPRDEVFSTQKSRDITAAGVRSAGHEAQTLLSGEKQFSSFEDLYELYAGKLDPTFTAQHLDEDGTLLKFPSPSVVQANKDAWMSDEEFARQRLAGMNAMVIERLKVFPPESLLDSTVYGVEECCITSDHIENSLESLSVEQAIHEKRLFILDYHNSFITPYLARINLTEGKAYGSRTIFFLTNAGKLLPVVIELILPPREGKSAWVNRVFTPPASSTIDWVWQLAKAHVAIVDMAYQHLCSHWLKTHACMEPFIIATRRQLSALHPVNVFLSPHFKDTMNANSAARESFLNSGGRIERCFVTGKYSNEVSSIDYKHWRFDEQALPKDLISRGMAEPDTNSKHGLRLLIEDYPYAVDGLDLWAVLSDWVEEYMDVYYKSDQGIVRDKELQAWWKEVREVGHADHKDAPWWVPMDNVSDLKEVATTLLWMATGLHAVVDFGQYPFAGFMPNSPTMGRRLIPEEGSAEFKQLLDNPVAFFLASVSTQRQSTTAMGTFELTSQHMSEEVYLAGDDPTTWTHDPRLLAAHERFKAAVNAANEQILARVRPPASTTSPNRAGLSQVPFTLLVPFSPKGLTARGVANSISI